MIDLDLVSKSLEEVPTSYRVIIESRTVIESLTGASQSLEQVWTNLS